MFHDVQPTTAGCSGASLNILTHHNASLTNLILDIFVTKMDNRLEAVPGCRGNSISREGYICLAVAADCLTQGRRESKSGRLTSRGGMKVQQYDLNMCSMFVVKQSDLNMAAARAKETDSIPQTTNDF